MVTRGLRPIGGPIPELCVHPVLRLVKSREDAEELAQDAFVKPLNTWKDFRGDSKFSTCCTPLSIIPVSLFFGKKAGSAIAGQ